MVIALVPQSVSVDVSVSFGREFPPVRETLNPHPSQVQPPRATAHEVHELGCVWTNEKLIPVNERRCGRRQVMKEAA